MSDTGCFLPAPLQHLPRRHERGARFFGIAAARDPHDPQRLRIIHQHARLARAFAVIPHAPVRAVAHAAALADDEIRRFQAFFETMRFMLMRRCGSSSK